MSIARLTSTFVPIPATFTDRTRRHARVLALLVLKRWIAAHPERTGALRDMGAGDFERIFSDPQARLRVSDILISGRDEDHQDFFDGLTGRRPSNLIDERTFLPDSKLLERLVGSSQYVVEPDADVVRDGWNRGLALIDRLDADGLGQIARGADLICGLRYEWGAIRAFSNPEIPGLIAFNVCAPPVILAEQIVHEASHVAVANCLALESRYSSLMSRNVGVFAPFTDSVRTVDRMVHGIVSYFAVRRLWKAIVDLPARDLPSDAFGSGVDREHIATRRLDVLDRRLRLALLCIHDALEPAAASAFVELFSELFPEDARFLQPTGSRKAAVEGAGYGTSTGSLTEIARAEIALARAGTKVSRISVPARGVAALGFALAADGPVVPASWSVAPIQDDRLDGFSNVAGAERSILDVHPEDEIHLYISHDAALAREAAALDQHGQAGTLLGIPECCRRRFAERWEECRRRGGDLFCDMVREYQVAGHLIVARECDASAMFRGGGLCWHFPCSPMCPATVEVVRARERALGVIDCALMEALRVAHVDRLWLDSRGRYRKTAPQGEVHELIQIDFA